jgi:Adenylate cyclase, family 3 (some proteins contain HAMP domain)
MTEIAKKYEATVDKFMGDAILIFFGDPHSDGVEQDAKNCLEMAISMRQQMKLLRERWIKMGYPPLHIRMGISPVIVTWGTMVPITVWPIPLLVVMLIWLHAYKVLRKLMKS